MVSSVWQHEDALQVFRPRHGAFKILHDSRLHMKLPSMHPQLLTGGPGTLHMMDAAHVFHAVANVVVSQHFDAVLEAWDLLQLFLMLKRAVLNVAQPVVNQTNGLALERSLQ